MKPRTPRPEERIGALLWLRVARAELRPLDNVPAGHDRDGADDEMLDPDDLDPGGESVAGDTLSWAQDRLMEAFPGAEEV